MRQKTKFLITILLVILIIDVFIAYEISISKRIYDYGFNKNEEVESVDLTEIKDGNIFTQTFVGKYDNLKCITIKFSDIFSNSQKVNQKMIVGLKDVETGDVIIEKEVLLNHIRVDKNYRLEFEKQENSESRQYEIYVKYINQDSEELAYTVKYYKTDTYEEGNLKIDGQETNFDLDFKDMYLNTKKVICLYVLMAVLNIAMYAISYSIYRDKNSKPEKVLLKILPIFSILLCLSITIGNGKDESSHLFRAYEVSEGVFITKIQNEKPIAIIPEAILEITSNRMGNYEEYYRMFENSIQGKMIRINIATSALYSPLQYFPQATGIALSKLVTDNAMLISYAGRLFNILICIIILYYAIKITPIGKNIFLLLSILPITVSGIATLSSDGLTTSMCFLFIAYVLKLAFVSEAKVRKRDLVLLGILSIFISICKIVYLPLIGLLLIIPKEKWGGRNEKILKVFVLWLIGVIVSIIWLSFASGILSIDRNGDSIIKLSMILENPFRYIQTILYTISNSIEEYINSMFGGNIEYDSTLIFHLTPYILMFLMIAVSFMDKRIKEISISKFQKTIIILVCLAIAFLIFTSLYIQWTEYGVDYVKGVQGRYFIPFAPLLFILLGRMKFERKCTEEIVAKIVGIIGAIMQIYIIMLVVLSHI